MENAGARVLLDCIFFYAHLSARAWRILRHRDTPCSEVARWLQVGQVPGVPLCRNAVLSLCLCLRAGPSASGGCERWREVTDPPPTTVRVLFRV